MEASKAYFPDPPLPRSLVERDFFEEYGSVGGVDINMRDGQLEMTVQKPPLSKNQHVLCATGPALPMSRPNKVSSTPDPCMSQIEKMLENLKVINYDVTVRGGHFRKQKKKFDELNQYKEHLIQCIADKSQNTPTPHGLKKPLATWKNTQDFFSDVPFVPEVNSAYTGGCLSVVTSPRSVDEVLLCHPQGMDSDIFSGHIFTTDGQRKETVQSHGFGSRILEIDTVVVNGKCFCSVRTMDKCCRLFELQDNKKIKICRLSEKTFKKRNPTGISLSPFICGECLIADSRGRVQLWHIEQETNLLGKLRNHRFVSPEKWCSAQFSAHPRQVMVTDRTGVAVWDVRAEPRKEEMFVLPSPQLQPCERIMVSRAHDSNPFYHLVATNNCLFILDQRMPKKTVLLWHHLLATPPQYMKVVTGVVKEWNNTTNSAGDCYDDVVLLASQSHPETICHQFNISHSDRPPVSSVPPWRIGRPGDLMGLGLKPPPGLQQCVVDQRLLAPLTGITAYKNPTSGFTAFQVTSKGDVFRQQFLVGEQSNERTWCGGPGSKHLSLSPEILQKWLKEVSVIDAHDAPEEVTTPRKLTRGEHSTYCADLLSVKTKKQFKCVLCNMDTRPFKFQQSVRDEPCENCGRKDLYAQKLLESGQKATCIQMNNPEYDDTDPLDIFKPDSEEPLCQLFIKLWNGDEDIQDLLKEKHEVRQGQNLRSVEKHQREPNPTSDISGEGDQGGEHSRTSPDIVIGGLLEDTSGIAHGNMVEAKQKKTCSKDGKSREKNILKVSSYGNTQNLFGAAAIASRSDSQAELIQEALVGCWERTNSSSSRRTASLSPIGRRPGKRRRVSER